MTSYTNEILVAERIRERLLEAEHERLARVAAARPGRGRPSRARLTLAIVRRLARVAEAS